MAFNGSGTHVRVHDWTADLSNAIPVTASRMDAEHDDISSALSNAICRDGQSTTTARIPFASGVSSTAGSPSSVAYAQNNDTNTGLYFPGPDQWGLAAGGTATLTGTSSAITVNATMAGNGGTLAISGAVTVSSTIAAIGDITHHGESIVPVGTVVDYAGTAAPNGWLLCFGQAVSRSTYAALFAALGTTYGSGDGSTTFNLPDLRGRVVAGQDDMGGTSANRLTHQSGGLDGDILGASGGSEAHMITEAQMPSHIHTATVNDTHAHLWSGPTTRTQMAVTTDGNPSNNYWSGIVAESTTGTSSGSISVSNASAGSDQAHNNVQPTIILNKIVYVGIYS